MLVELWCDGSEKKNKKRKKKKKKELYCYE